MKKIAAVLITLLIAIIPAFSSVTAYIQGSYAFSLDTNIFSNPLPQNVNNTWLEYRMNTAPFLKRFNHGFNTELNLFFSENGKTGLSTSLSSGFPFKATEIRPDSTNANSDWSYVSTDATDIQDRSLFFGIGPIFRAKFSFLDLGLSLRVSIGTYDTFADNIVMGLQAEPYLNFHFTDYTYFNLGITYDAHLMKFLPSSTVNYYEEHYFMLTLAPYVGIGIRIGER